MRRRFEELIAEAEATPVVGWDFSWLGARITTSTLPWDYDRLVVERARRSPDLLDLGTGGGEWLAALPYRPPRTVATEGWPPNVAVATARLRPLGVDVVPVEPAPDNVDQEPDERRGRLPFAADSFHLVVNRHEAFVAADVARVLAAGGVFLTQQVGGTYDGFYHLLGLEPPPRSATPWRLALAIAQIEAAGLELVSAEEAEQVTSFSDVGALIWYLKAVPWTVPGFSPAAHRDRLAELHDRVTRGGRLEAWLRTFWLEARKATGETR